MRLFWFLIRLFVLISIVLWLAQSPGAVEIQWGGQLIETSAAMLAFLVVIAFVVLLTLDRGWRAFRDGFRLFKLHRTLRRKEEALKALSRGLAALAVGDGRGALVEAARAQKLIGAIGAVQLIKSQAAQMTGDAKSGETVYRALMQDAETASAGYRGLIERARVQNDTPAVHRLLVEATHMYPDAPWLAVLRMEESARDNDWGVALADLPLARRGLTADRYARCRSAIYWGLAELARREEKTDEAFKQAKACYNADKAWTASGMVYVAALIAKGKLRRAAWMLETLWRERPHPQMVELYLRAKNVSEIVSHGREVGALAQYRALERLTRKNPHHDESRLALAEAALGAKLWGETRRHLGALTDAKTSKRAFRLFAELERRERRDEAGASLWLTRGMEAAETPPWTCTSCNAPHHTPTPVCAACGALGTVE